MEYPWFNFKLTKNNIGNQNLPPYYPKLYASFPQYLGSKYSKEKCLSQILFAMTQPTASFFQALWITIYTIWNLPEIIRTESFLSGIEGAMISSHKLHRNKERLRAYSRDVSVSILDNVQTTF